MKKQLQLQKAISVLMSFILMIEFTGCYSSKILSTSEISGSEKYAIHNKNSVYYADKAVISDGILSCKLDFSERNYSNSHRTHIYLSSDSLLKITSDFLSMPVNTISKIEQKVPDKGKTKALAFILIVAGIGIGVGLVFMISDMIKIVADIPVIANGGPNSSTGLCTNW
jgi:hypothetical protein